MLGLRLVALAAGFAVAMTFTIGASAGADPPGADTTQNGDGSTDITINSGTPGAVTPPSGTPGTGGDPGAPAPNPYADWYQDSNGTWHNPDSSTLPMFQPGATCGSANRNPNVQGPVLECQPAPPAGPDAAQVAATGLQLAQSIVTGMQIRPITIGIVPESSDPVPHTGLIGLPVWLWAANPSENTVGPITRFATAGAVTVAATGVLTNTLFSLGDGGIPIPCPQPMLFTPYFDAAMNLPSPSCGNPMGFAKTSIDSPGGMFTVTATSFWLVTWTATAGAITAGGVIPVTPVANTRVRVGEVQVLNAPAPPK